MGNNFSRLPRNRDEAKDIGSVSYFTGQPCKNGHVDKRYSNTGICYSCKRDRANIDYCNHTDRVTETNKRSYAIYKLDRMKIKAKWSKLNLAQVRLSKKKNKIKYKTEYNEKEQVRVRAKRSSDPLYRLNRNAAKAVWDYLKNRKTSDKFSDIFNWSWQELYDHIESQFSNAMNWENYGTCWEIDHILPLCSFESWNGTLYEKFSAAWVLWNLRLCTIEENAIKNKNIDWLFTLDYFTNRLAKQYNTMRYNGTI